MSSDLIAVTEAVEVMNQAMNVVKEKKKLFDQTPKTQEKMIELFADLDDALARARDASHKVHALKWPAGWMESADPVVRGHDATANDTQWMSLQICELTWSEPLVLRTNVVGLQRKRIFIIKHNCVVHVEW